MARMFMIHHANGPKRFTETDVMPREYAGFVHAESIEEAFKLSQNDFNPEWASQENRSTSVGDIIQDDDKFFMVCGMGFKELV